MNSLITSDNKLVLDNSMIEALQTCPRYFDYAYRQRRVPAVASPGRNFGSALHAGWATRYKRCGSRATGPEDVAAINDSIVAYLAQTPQPERDFRTLQHALTFMSVYNQVYQDEPFQILATQRGPIVESSFLIPIGRVLDVDIFYSGRMDLGLRDSSGLWVLDFKTTFQFGDTFEREMAMDTGQLGYAWAFSRIFGEKPNGYITSACRVRKPRKGDEYDNISPVDETDFKRLLTCVNDSMLRELECTVLDWAETLIRYERNNHFPRVSGKKGCVRKYGVCDYYETCAAPVETRERLLASSMYQDNTWSALNRKDDKND